MHVSVDILEIYPEGRREEDYGVFGRSGVSGLGEDRSRSTDGQKNPNYEGLAEN